ncbi:MAG: hypothetical protein LUC33_00575 [Prevotellaceae bacterium]|nr:hypothetical protein [Prevotellaceae bacterium]
MAVDLTYLPAQAEAILTEELTALKERITANHIAAGQRVTGKTAESMQVTVTPDEEGGLTGLLSGRAYFGVLETGSRPWTNPHYKTAKDGHTWPSAPKWFIDIIAQWASDKGLDIASPWGVATKIMTQGSRLYREGGRTDIYSEEIEAAVRAISDRILALFDVQLTNSLLRG